MPLTNHTELLNYLIEKFELKSYLEIGVQNPANNFDKINCEDKWGCDPEVKNNANIFPWTSDELFELLAIRPYDLIFIDGLHEKDQVKGDFENSLRCLNDNGFIVLHDTLPDKEEHTHVPRDSKTWYGDVYKFAMTLSTYENINFRTLDMDCGCTVVWKEEIKPPVIDKEIDWNYYQQHKSILLNIIAPSQIEEIKRVTL